jgi:hypothetical protein
MDPLAQLKDIHLPGAVHSYPIAPGWWLVAITVLVLLVFIGLKLRRYTAKHKTKKMALKQLINTNDSVAVVKILKWALLAYFPRSQVAHLSGDNLKAFLTMTIPTEHQENFQQLSANNFNLVYQCTEKMLSQADLPSNAKAAEFAQAAKLWLSHALPPRGISDLENQDLSKGSLARTEKSTPKATEIIGAKS